MDKQKVIKKLNEALERELNEVVRYLHQSFWVAGPGKAGLKKLCREQSRESMDHATRLGEKIVALGGDPVVKILEIYEPKRLGPEGMLKNDLKHEREALEGYREMLPLVEDDPDLKRMITQLVREEGEHVGEIERTLKRKS